ncbi:hypothetical protein CVT24_011263 [Panaeolus cyanescens]|uniref:Uncharacterized protein n=1 Tax=Panaeolus cyanescens TaxID=181874 RepID=A0A409WX02_9AGAR|nr:hypothetical protein CVT24_011263 [Panaeolus cyanescens]
MFNNNANIQYTPVACEMQYYPPTLDNDGDHSAFEGPIWVPTRVTPYQSPNHEGIASHFISRPPITLTSWGMMPQIPTQRLHRSPKRAGIVPNLISGTPITSPPWGAMPRMLAAPSSSSFAHRTYRTHNRVQPYLNHRRPPQTQYQEAHAAGTARFTSLSSPFFSSIHRTDEESWGVQRQSSLLQDQSPLPIPAANRVMARFHSPAQSISPSPSVSSMGSGASWSRSYSPTSSTTSISSSWSTSTRSAENPSGPNKNGYQIRGLRLGPQQPQAAEINPTIICSYLEEFGVQGPTSDNKRKRGYEKGDDNDESQRKKRRL